MEIIHGEGCRQKARQAAPRVTWVRRLPVIRSSSAASRVRARASMSGLVLLTSFSSRASSAVIRLRVAGRSTRSAAARAVSGSPSAMAAVRTR